MRVTALSMIMILSLLVPGACGGSAEVATAPEEVSGPDISVPLPPEAVRFRLHDDNPDSLLLEYWVPSSVEDATDFYLEEFADWEKMHHF